MIFISLAKQLATCNNFEKERIWNCYSSIIIIHDVTNEKLKY